MRPVRRSFFEGDAADVAPRLLGKVLRVGACAGRIVEVEAYHQDDPASHSFRGSTPRNAVMFGPAGHLYVYFTYGMHHCANVVTGHAGVGQGVLIRALSPLAGIEEMIARRGRRDHLTDGPGKLCQALGLDLTDNGTDLCAPGSTIALLDDGMAPPAEPLVGPRVGISVAIDTPWRWRVPA